MHLLEALLVILGTLIKFFIECLKIVKRLFRFHKGSKANGEITISFLLLPPISRKDSLSLNG